MTIEQIRERIKAAEERIEFYDNSDLHSNTAFELVEIAQRERNILLNLICDDCEGTGEIVGTLSSMRQINEPENIRCSSCHGTGVK